MALLGQLAAAGSTPGTPTIGAATAGNTQATVAFTAPSYTGKGGAVTYRALSTPGNVAATGPATPITVTGLTNGVSYTFQVRTETSYGINSAYSSASGAVTPVAPPVPTPPAPTPPAPTPPAPTPPAPTPPAPTPPAPTPPAPCTGCGNCQNVIGVCPSDPNALATFYTCYDSCGNVCSSTQVGQCFS